MNSQELRALQEAYSQVYDEGYKSFPHGKVEAKAKRLGADSRTNEPLTGKSDSEVDSILARKKKSGERATSLNLASRTAHSYLPQKKAERNKTQKEQVDLYDIILSHLLDEGYADTEQAAKAIMVNMSEDWRESIVEEVLDEVTSADYTALAKTKKPRSKESIQARYHAKRLSKPEPETGKKSSRSSSPLRSKMTQDTRDAGRLAAEYGSYDEPGYGSSSKGSLPKGKKLERQKKTGVSD
jgi:hypothetical protein